MTGAAGAISDALAAFGLAALPPAPATREDALPEIAPDTRPGSLLLAVNAGSAFWPHFAASPEFDDDRPDPLNRWSARVISEIAGTYGTTALFPFEGPPFWPFQQWALRTGALSRSPLGVLAHRRWGLWFAFRGAVLLPDAAEADAGAPGGPCEACADKPCLDACPAGALTREVAYRPDLCRTHVAGQGRTTCGRIGCLVRHACPYGQGYAYAPEQAQFHMRAFTGAARR